MVPGPRSSRDGTAGDVFDADVCIGANVNDDALRARSASSMLTAAAGMLGPDSVRQHSNRNRLGRVPQRIGKEQQQKQQQQQQQPLASKQSRQRRIKFSSVVFAFFVGFLSTALLSFVHLHRFESSPAGDDAPLLFPKTMRDASVDFRDRHPASGDPKTAGAMPEVSACLIVMDDNHFLIEWLAYHYMNANLRHLIVTSDPHSNTSPSGVLDRWKDRINIEVWNETRFIPDDYDETVRKTSHNNTKLMLLNDHRVRQASFNLECLREFKRQDRGLTMMIDSDEYIMPRNDEEPDENVNMKSKTTSLRKKKPAPNIKNVLSSLNISAGFAEIQSPCQAINRVQFSAKESPKEKVQAMVAPGFDGMDFQTLRWRHSGFQMEWHDTKFGLTCGSVRHIPNKVIIDLSRLTLDEVMSKDNPGNPHKPLTVCPENVYANLRQAPFLLHHYMGTPKQWFYRTKDKRGIGYRQARYEDMNVKFGVNESDSIRPWLGDFVAAVGSDEAQRLLSDVGKLEPLPDATGESERKVNDDSENIYEVGEIVEVDFAGEGVWHLAEIYASYSDNHYSVFFPDCTQEIATFASRMRRTNRTFAPVLEDNEEDDAWTDVPTIAGFIATDAPDE